MKTFLHVGCGSSTREHTTAAFAGSDWREVRLDIDQTVKPDIVGTMTNMAAVEAQSVDALFSSHNIEHLYIHEVPLALAEFLRVLKIDGFAVITCPDLQSVAALVAQGILTEPAYLSPQGPIAPMDILYGFRPALAAGNLFMAHRCGFTERVLTNSLMACGFASVVSRRRPAAFDLWAVAAKSPTPETTMRALAMEHFPT